MTHEISAHFPLAKAGHVTIANFKEWGQVYFPCVWRIEQNWQLITRSIINFPVTHILVGSKLIVNPKIYKAVRNM